MIPYRGPHRSIRRDPTCRETGRLVHQNGDAGAYRGRAGILTQDSKPFDHNRLRRHFGRDRPARIVHPPQLPAEGWRQTRSIIIEET